MQQPMQINPLDSLRSIHLPDPISWWPLATSAWITIALIVILITGLLYFIADYRRKTAYKKIALHNLENISTKTLDNSQFISELNRLLKQCLMVKKPREDIARLQGDQWLNTLDALHQSTAFSQGSGRILGTDAYRPIVDLDRNTLIKLTQDCIKRLPKQ